MCELIGSESDRKLIGSNTHMLSESANYQLQCDQIFDNRFQFDFDELLIDDSDEGILLTLNFFHAIFVYELESRFGDISKSEMFKVCCSNIFCKMCYKTDSLMDF